MRLGIARGDAPARDYELERQRIRVPAVASRVVTVDGEKIGYLQLAQFTKGSADAVRDAVEALREKGATALVLDLRGDPGGLVNEAVGVAGVFLPDGTPVVVTEGLHSPRKTFDTEGDPAAGDLPLFVLVNRGSASASEILAGALRDADRGELVGERTFGKALVQSTRPLRDGGALKLTTARYLTPDGLRPRQARPAARRAGRGRSRDTRARRGAAAGAGAGGRRGMSRGGAGGDPGLRAGAGGPRGGRAAGVRARAADPARQGRPRRRGGRRPGRS